MFAPGRPHRCRALACRTSSTRPSASQRTAAAARVTCPMAQTLTGPRPSAKAPPGVRADAPGGRCLRVVGSDTLDSAGASCVVPEPEPRGVGSRPDPDPGVRAVHHRGDHRRDLDRRAALGGAWRSTRHRLGHRGLGGHLRPGRRPALPRDHRQRALLPGRARPVAGVLRLGGRARRLGCDRARRGRRLDRLPAARDQAAAVRGRGAPGIAVAQAIGRWGNYFNQELFGRPTDLPWGVRIDPDRPSTVPGATAYHPTFLYESLWDLALAGVLVYVDRRFRMGRGRVFALYVMGYTAGRVWIELLRIDTANHVLGLRVNVWTSILVFAGGLAYFLLHPGPRETVVEPGAGPATDAPTGAADTPAGEDVGRRRGHRGRRPIRRRPPTRTHPPTRPGPPPTRPPRRRPAARNRTSRRPMRAGRRPAPRTPASPTAGASGPSGPRPARRPRAAETGERAESAETGETADERRDRPRGPRRPTSAETADDAPRRPRAPRWPRRPTTRRAGPRRPRRRDERLRRRHGGRRGRRGRGTTRRTRSPVPRTGCRPGGGSGSGPPIRDCAHAVVAAAYIRICVVSGPKVSAPADSRSLPFPYPRGARRTGPLPAPCPRT